MSELPRVFVTRSLEIPIAGGPPADPLAPLRSLARCTVAPDGAPLSPESLRAAATGCRGLLCMLTDRVDRTMLESCPGLEVVSTVSVGVDHIDLAAASELGIAIGHTPGVLVEATADLAFGLLLAAARRIPEADRFVRAGRWQQASRWSLDMMLGRELYGATLGIVGLGAIGQAVARRAQGFGLRCIGWTRSGRVVAGVESLPLATVLREADFVSVHVALSPETRGLLGAEQIAAMKPGAVLVDTARGGIVDEVAVASALHSGQLAAAGFDVFEDEPLPPSSPLLDAPGAVLVPHIGSATATTRRRMVALAVENLRAGLEGRPLPHAANPEVVPGAGSPRASTQGPRGEPV